MANWILKVIATPESRNFLKELSETCYSPGFNVYTFYQERISKITGAEWDCLYAKEFYNVEWTIESINLQQNTLASSGDNNEELVIQLGRNSDSVTNSESQQVVVWIDKDNTD